MAKALEILTNRSLAVIRSIFTGCPEGESSGSMAEHDASIWSDIRHLERFYPNFEAWFHTTVLPGVRKGTRRISTKRIDGRIVGIAIAKRDTFEKKLCTLWVLEDAQGLGIAGKLAAESFEWLATDKPLFTVPEERLEEFRKLLARWNFHQTQELVGAYRPGKSEYVFNGSLAPLS